MNSLVKVMPKLKKFNEYMENVKNNTFPITLSGITDVAKIQLAYSTSFYAERPICIITYNELQAKKLVKDFKYFTEEVYLFPKKEILAYDFYAESQDIFHERIEVLNKIHQNKAKVVVTTIEAVMQKLMNKTSLFKSIVNIKQGDTIKLDKLKEILTNLGYERCELVEGKGQYSIRGGIIDIAPVSIKHGIRIELWGDEVDSIRTFNIKNQRSDEMLENYCIYPATEFLLELPLEEVCENILELDYTNKQKEIINEDIERIKSGDYINKVDKYFDDFYPDSNTLLDYLSKNFLVFLDEEEKIERRSESLIKENDNIAQNLIEKEKVIPQAILNQLEYLSVKKQLNSKDLIYMETQDIITENLHAKRNGYSFYCREVNFFRSSLDLYFQEIQKAKRDKKTVIILGGNVENCKKISNILFEKKITNDLITNLNNELKPEEVIVATGAFSAGVEYKDLNLLILTGEELFSGAKKKTVKNTSFKQGEKIVFADLKPGDYVVHHTHGIGQYIGINTITTEKITKDYIKIKYRKDDILYVPTNQLDSIRKYIGVGEREPKLSAFGGKDWENTKEKVKKGLQEVAKGLIELYAKREQAVGFAFSKDNEWQKEFEGLFPYQETEDQLRAITELKQDMEQAKPMDRLLCGDVGYGKTEVAIRGAFKACMAGKQVAYLVPTTILASQQYETFRERMKDYPIKVEVLNRFRTKKEQDKILKDLELGQVDILIGTHRIIQKDIRFKDLGFLIIDEEHRFGVMHKEKIKELKNNVDVLTMTATPIPRTLHMSIMGIRDMSCLYEPPQNRRPVQTYVLEYDEEIANEAITKELERGGQVFYLYNKVETIEKKANEIAKLVPEAKVAFAHGQMTGKELEDIMADFVDNKINVLVCTTILESGIDIPNANTIIVEDADRLGLAQLYQIRGRVGRSDKQAYAYITYKRDKMLKEIADKRLKAIKEFTEFGSGFKIAMRDLEIRGAGSLLGEMQHGHMDQVGYDTYCRLLDTVVKEITGQEKEIEEQDITIDLNVSAFIPDEFIENSAQKIEVYQNIALCKNKEDIQDVTDEIIDRYGKLPEEIENLLKVASIKILSKKLGIIKIMQKNDKITFSFIKESLQVNMEKILATYKTQVMFSAGITPYFTYRLNMVEQVLKETEKFLEEIKK